MKTIREEACLLHAEYNRDLFHIKRALIAEAVMRYFAKEPGYGADPRHALFRGCGLR